jgi:hypothetical protein
MKRLRRIDTRDVYKWKARLTVHWWKADARGSAFGRRNAPVVNRTSILPSPDTGSLEQVPHTTNRLCPCGTPKHPQSVNVYGRSPAALNTTGAGRHTP